MINRHNLKERYYRLFFTMICGLLMLLCGSQFIIPSAFASKPAEAHSLLNSLKNDNISIRVEKLSVANLLRSIGKRAGVNIFISPEIKRTKTMTVDLTNTTLYDLFQLIISTNNLQYSEKNNVIQVDPKRAEPIITTQLCPQYSDTSDLLKQLKPLLSPKGVITASKRDNCFVVQDNAEKIKRVRAMLKVLDQPVSQIHIKASIVKVTQEAKRQLGITWDYKGNYKAADMFTGKISTAATSLKPATTNNLGISLGYVNADFALDFALNALQQDNLALVLSSPQILVKDGKTAKIKQGTEIAFDTTTTDGGTNTTFKEANLSLEVTPKIQGKLISIKLTVNNGSVGQTINNNASLNTQEITTDLLLKDGVTAVIGGIMLKSDGKGNDSVPGLSKIPILGYLFKSHSKDKKRDELLVFITANVVTMNKPLPISRKTADYLKKSTNSTLLTGEKMDLTPLKLLEK